MRQVISSRTKNKQKMGRVGDGVLFTTCGRDLFRISMTIDLHVWSSIAGYGSRKRCWLEDQKCGQFRMVVRAHFRAFSLGFFFLFFFLVTKHSAMHDSCSFYFITTMLWVALDVGYISIAKSVVFSRWATVRHMRTILIGNYRSASIYGSLGAARRHW